MPERQQMLPRPFLEDVKSTLRGGGEDREGGSDLRSSWARADVRTEALVR